MIEQDQTYYLSLFYLNLAESQKFIVFKTHAKHFNTANIADPDQTAPKEQSDQGLHCLSFYHRFRLIL